MQMIVPLFVFAWLQITSSFGRGDLNLTGPTCSRIVSTPNVKTEPLIIITGEVQETYAIVENDLYYINVEHGECDLMDPPKIWKPCNAKSGYVNISMKEAPEMDQLVVTGTSHRCVLTFAQKRKFKPVAESAVIPEASFPFMRYAGGSSSVKVNFSVNGTNYNSKSYLIRNNETICEWSGMKLEANSPHKNCGNFRVNAPQNRLDYTFECVRENMENITSLALYTADSIVGVTIDWTKEGVSPDMIDCASEFHSTN
nr:diagnostic antigen gp50 [Hymenolepis microstoma]